MKNILTVWLFSGDRWFSLLHDEMVKEQEGNRIFACGQCSDETTTVFHNIIGFHDHQSASDLRAMVAEATQAG